MCIAHMGHLAHTLDDQQIFSMGRVDVALVPVDRIVSQSYEELRHNLNLVKPRLIIPMHFISDYFADDFSREVENLYTVRRHDGNSITVSRATLPEHSEVVILKPLRIFRFGGSEL
jgi:L-ascorbate metabolism protein UlaG (beta-lactamase superfamily)